MEFQIESRAGTISVAGDMTVYAAAELKTALLAEVAAGNSRLDLAQVQEFDTSAVQLLLLLNRELLGGLKIVACSPGVRATLELMNVKLVSEAA
ncbi:MAG: STAS domain-containing protein [Proteobacteria bacterium]|nr:STAS domain-containing protein [Pseudomonadota bacterium]